MSVSPRHLPEQRSTAGSWRSALRCCLLLLLLALVLLACAETSTPPPGPTPAESPVPATPVRPAATGTGEIGLPTAAPAEPESVPEPAAVPSTPAPALTTGAASPWPAFQRALDLSIPAGNSYGPRALVVHPGLNRLYVRTHRLGPQAGEEGLVAVLDLDSGQVLALAETGPDPYSEGGLALDRTRDRLYVVDVDQAQASVLDAGTLDRLATLDGVDQLALDEASGRVYVAGLARLRLLESGSYELLRETPLAYASRFLHLALDPAGDRVYLTYEESGSYVLSLHDAGSLAVQATTPLPGRPDALVADPDRGQAYLTLNDGEHNLLWVLAGDGQVVEKRILGDWTQHTYLALDPGGDRLFLGRDAYGDRGITVLDLAAGQPAADIPLDQTPGALAWDGASGRLFVSHTYAHSVGVVDVQQGRVTGTYPTALDLADLAVDPARGYLYATDTAGRLHVLDAATGDPLALLPGAGRIAVDSPHARFYTGGQGADRVRIYDAATLQQTGEIRSQAIPVADAFGGGLYLVRNGVYLASLETMTVTAAISDTLPQASGFSPNPSAVDAVVDPGSGRLFAIVNNGVPGSNNGNYLHVYEPLTYERTLTDTERSPIYLDVDPGTGRAYVSRTHMAGQSTALLEAGRAYTARLDAVFGPLRVDPALGRLYLTTDELLLVLDAADLRVLGSVPIPAGFSLRALDPQRHLLYLATDAGRVQIWSATGGALPGATESVQAEPPPPEIRRLFLGPGDAPIFTGSLFRSEDAGITWSFIGAGLPDDGVQDLAVSPTFDRDGTLFAGLIATNAGLGIWKTEDGGQTWRMANRGLSDLALIDLALSPAFPGDGTLFALTRSQGLFRSTDGGETWESLAARYRAGSASPQFPASVTISPTYGDDQTLFLGHDGLQRSTDGGETWTRIWPRAPDSLTLSPAYARDRTLFAWFGDGGLLRSTDGGDTWHSASTGLFLSGFGSNRVLIPADFAASQTVYFVWQPSLPEDPPQFFRSLDGGDTWQRLAGDPPRGATPLELSADGSTFLALDEAGKVRRWPAGDLDWQPAALPPLDRIAVDRLVLSTDFPQTPTLYAVSEGTGILRSVDGGLTWSDTGFPLRLTYGGPPDLVVLPPDTLLVGTPLGLYRAEAGGPWEIVSEGLPREEKVRSLHSGPDGSLRALLGAEGQAPRVFLSTDGGGTWREPVPPLPLPIADEDLHFSPAFATDRTAFLAAPWDRPLRTVGGGPWQPYGPPGEWRLTALQLSPAFDRDRLLFVRLEDNSLWRSTDGGDTWADVSGPWGGEAPRDLLPPAGYLLNAVTFSPDYAADGVLLTGAGPALYRSTDGGTTWLPVLDLAPPPARLLFSPDYARDGTVYLHQGGALYHSTDRGQTWQALPPPPWTQFDEVSLLASPTFDRDRTLWAWMLAGPVYASSDGGRSWRDVSQGLPDLTIRQILPSPGHAADRLLYLVPFQGGIYKRVGEGPWVPVTAQVAPPAPAPSPTPGPAPLVCTTEPERFRAVWQAAQDRLGCPQVPAQQLLLAEQPFERGRMIWDSSTSRIYVLEDGGTWQAYDDTFQEGLDPAYDPDLPPPPRQPQRGFGKVWREQLGGPQSSLGWALEGERPIDGWRLPFDGGLLLWTDAGPGTAYLLYADNTWTSIPSPP